MLPARLLISTPWLEPGRDQADIENRANGSENHERSHQYRHSATLLKVQRGGQMGPERKNNDKTQCGADRSDGRDCHDH